MNNRNEIILEVCENLVHQVNMKILIDVTKWQRIRMVAYGAFFGFLLGVLIGSLFGGAHRGAIWGTFIGVSLGSTASVNLRREKKRADEIIRNELTSEQKLVLVEYVRIYFEGKRLIDTATTLSAISKIKDQEPAIRRSVSIFFRNEMDYVVNNYENLQRKR